MAFGTRTSGFSNSRDWRSFLSGAQPTAYANVATALKAGHAWLTGRRWAQGTPSGPGLIGSVSGTHKAVGVCIDVAVRGA
jgi:hypothetical protein